MRPASLCVLLALTLAGCSSDDSATKSDEDRLVSQRDFFIRDVPIPDGFKIDKSSSLGSETPTQRYYQIVAKGSEKVERVARFYRERKMPLYKWTFVEQDLTPKGMTMLFTKDGEKCEISIDRRVFGTYIRLTVRPMVKEAAD